MFRSFGQSLRAINSRDLSKDPRLQIMARLWISLSEQQREDVCRQTSADTNRLQTNACQSDHTQISDMIRLLDDQTRDVIRQNQQQDSSGDDGQGLQDNCQLEVGSVFRDVTSHQELQALVQMISRQLSDSECGDDDVSRDASNLCVFDQTSYSILSAVMDKFCNQMDQNVPNQNPW